MKQTIHIIKKDLRRFSWEIFASLALLALYGWCQPASWQSLGEYLMTHGSGAFRYFGAMWLGALLVLWWMALLVRLIQEESPAGDRQFWVTRPYRWPSLLAAKALLFLALVNLPLLVVQLFLLRAAGFPPFQSFGRLLLAHLVLLGWLLPIGALAVVASGRTQLSRVAIVALLFLIALGFAGTNVAIDFYSHSDTTTGWDWAARLLLVGIFLVVIVRQYARRRTSQARWILLGGALAVTILSFAEPKSTLNEAEYPLLTSTSGNSFEMRVPQRDTFVSTNQPEPWIALPLFSRGVPPGHVVQLRAVKATFAAQDGTRWSSGWLEMPYVAAPGENPGSQTNGLQSYTVGIPMDRQFFKRNKDKAVNIHVVAAAALFRDHESPGAVSAAGELQIPGVGACAIPEMGLTLACRSTYAPLPLLGVTSRVFKQCPPDKDDLAAPPELITNWTPGELRGNGGFGLSAVRIFMPYRNTYTNAYDSQARKICRESAFTLHRPELIQMFRVQSDASVKKLSNLTGRP